MRLLDITLPTPAENLALDEALLVDSGEPDTLRVWESTEPFVVLGRSSRVADEVDPDACVSDDVPIYRRVSGGGAIVSGPGCLMYAVVLDTAHRQTLRSVDAAHRYVLSRLADSLRRIDETITVAGASDLASRKPPGAQLVKFSGNSLRIVRSRLLYHGTLLYDADLELIARVLAQPPREPEYRRSRSHTDFICNLHTDRGTLRSAVLEGWSISEEESLSASLAASVRRLVRERYGLESWRFSR